MNKKLFLSVFILLLSLTACDKPALRPMAMPKVPDGHPHFVAGWKAGCETGLSAHGGSMIKTFNEANVDSRMTASPLYRQGWNSAFRYCRYHAKYTQNDELFNLERSVFDSNMSLTSLFGDSEKNYNEWDPNAPIQGIFSW